MRVLIACEFSQVVCKAFRERGHEAYSCDLLPTEGNPEWHIQDDVLKHLNDGWDLMIAHPDCKYLARVGLRWLIGDKERYSKMVEACNFFNVLLNAPIDKIAIENPVQHRFAQEYIPHKTQTIEPYYFGDTARKRTWLWLKNLPNLSPTSALWNPEPVKYLDKRGHKHYTTCMVSGKNKSQERARTFQGIAQAMASQWG